MTPSQDQQKPRTVQIYWMNSKY